MVAHLPDHCRMKARQVCDEGDKNTKKSQPEASEKTPDFRMANTRTGTRSCRKCFKPFIPGTFWGKETQCKACKTHHARIRFLLKSISPPITRACRTCSKPYVACTRFYMNHRICHSCKHAYEGKRYTHIMSLPKPPTWVASEASAARSLELALALTNRETPQ